MRSRRELETVADEVEVLTEKIGSAEYSRSKALRDLTDEEYTEVMGIIRKRCEQVSTAEERERSRSMRATMRARFKG